jgi:hypothetical protein
MTIDYAAVKTILEQLSKVGLDGKQNAIAQQKSLRKMN